MRQHDLTHMYSDDSDVRGKGHREVKAIRELAGVVGPVQAEAIWNYWVQKKLVKDIPNHFWWQAVK